MTGSPRAVLCAIGVALVLASVALGIAVRGGPAGPDVALRDRARELGPLFVQAADVVSFLLSPGMAVITVVSLGLRAILARELLVFKAAVLLGVAWCTILLRFGYDRVRPVVFDLPSYPSGHVTAVTAVAFTGVVLCAHLARRHLRKAVLLAVVAVVLTAASRVALTMHWFTDTVGAALATTGVGLLAALVLRLLPWPGGPRPAGPAGRRRVEP
ncbi:phosphatase PAP2 family protein [Actinosynnema sp. NPDC047251]|uniref:Putative secreted protein n=1 Tax=Saccharothrix espanaensis (strain ATCC 51144 / DSM 44229 / JCM 9112 / NBRC 15066 / NRRL 15764) TaxID=1179773 RepID=K0JVT4_SACES|nr:phosphatase PAP2 family protein [Saccharothrix espanaensis]CCH28919.1 putative secreted protein [Saccharothrix espanaensis DSM 44229]